LYGNLDQYCFSDWVLLLDQLHLCLLSYLVLMCKTMNLIVMTPKVCIALIH